MRVIGIMSGTSHDGIDVAAADFSVAGDVVRMRPLGFLEYPIPADLDGAVARATDGGQLDALMVCRMDTELGQLFAAAAQDAISAFAEDPDLIVSHGQTIWHWEERGQTRGSLQLGNPAWIAEYTGVAVLSDIRMRDIAAGGNGAPIVSMFDTLLAADRFDEAVAFLNLGGIANMTVVGGGRTPIAYDLGPANALIDAAVVRFTHGVDRFDVDGTRAQAGTVQTALLKELFSHDYYDIDPPKTTGKETFGPSYLAETLTKFPGVSEDDVIATLTEHAAELVASEAIRQQVSHVVASGGGVRNLALIDRIIEKLGDVAYLTTADLGVPTDAKEAYMSALIGFLSVNGMGGTVPSCTGASRSVILGTLTPGSGDRPFPVGRPRPEGVSRLEIVMEERAHGTA